MIVFDVEIEKCIPGREQKNPKYQYAESWTDFVGMGIACVCVMDYAEGRPRVFLKDNLSQLNELLRRSDCIVGFNNHKFDNQLLMAHGVTIDPRRSYDILEEVWKALGIGLKYNSGTHGGFSLDAFVQKNFAKKKSGKGRLAPELWQDGCYGEVIDYCHNDVNLTHDLLSQILSHGYLINPKTNKRIWLRKPSPEVKYG